MYVHLFFLIKITSDEIVGVSADIRTEHLPPTPTSNCSEDSAKLVRFSAYRDAVFEPLRPLWAPGYLQLPGPLFGVRWSSQMSLRTRGRRSLDQGVLRQEAFWGMCLAQLTDCLWEPRCCNNFMRSDVKLKCGAPNYHIFYFRTKLVCCVWLHVYLTLGPNV